MAACHGQGGSAIVQVAPLGRGLALAAARSRYARTRDAVNSCAGQHQVKRPSPTGSPTDQWREGGGGRAGSPAGLMAVFCNAAPGLPVGLVPARA